MARERGRVRVLRGGHMNTTGICKERSVEVVGLNVRFWEGGTGEPLVVVHHDIGN